MNKKPVTDSEAYYLDASGKRIMGGANAAVATVGDPNQFWIPGGEECIVSQIFGASTGEIFKRVSTKTTERTTMLQMTTSTILQRINLRIGVR